MRAAAQPMTVVARRDYTIPQWIVWARMTVAGRVTRPTFLLTGVPATQDLEVVVVPPDWSDGITVGYMGERHPQYLPASASPVLLVEPQHADPARGHYATGPHVLVIPGGRVSEPQ